MTRATLSEVCEIIQGGRLKLSGHNFVPNGYPAFGAGGLNGYLETAEFDRTGIVLSSIGARCGKCFFAEGEWTSLANTQVILPDPQRADARFLWFQLNDEARWPRSGTAQPFIKPSDVKRHDVYLPPLDEQRRIAAILDQADALRRRRAEMISRTRQLAVSLFESVRSAAKGRGTRSLSDVYWFQEGPGVRKWQFTESGVKLLNVGNITKRGLLDLSTTTRHVSDREARAKYAHFLADEGDLVIASSGISFDTDGLLRTRGAFVRAGDLPLCMNTSTIRFKRKADGPTLTFLQQWLGTYEFRSQITRLVTGSAQQNFGPSHLRSVEITVPDLRIEADLTTKVAAVEASVASQSKQLEELDALFASLQHRAFRGELTAPSPARVPEPA